MKDIVAKFGAETRDAIRNEQLGTFKLKWRPMVAVKLQQYQKEAGVDINTYASTITRVVLGEQMFSARFSGDTVKQRITLAMSLGYVKRSL